MSNPLLIVLSTIFITSLFFFVCFHSQDAGDINIKAIYNSIISNKIYIEDINYYDLMDYDNTSRYSLKRSQGTLTFDTDHYVLLKTVNDDITTFELDDYVFNTPCHVSLDFKLVDGNNLQFNVGLNGLIGHVSYIDSRLSIFKTGSTYNFSNELTHINFSFSKNTWYTLEVDYSQTEINVKLLLNDEIIASVNYAETIQSAKLILQTAYQNTITTHLKNLKIKSL